MNTKILNRFTRKQMTSKYSIEEEILSYITRLETNLMNANKKIEYLEKTVADIKPSGRKDKFNILQKEQIRGLRSEGISIQSLAKHFNCSTTLIHKICKDIDLDLRKTNKRD